MQSQNKKIVQPYRHSSSQLRNTRLNPPCKTHMTHLYCYKKQETGQSYEDWFITAEIPDFKHSSRKRECRSKAIVIQYRRKDNAKISPHLSMTVVSRADL